MGARVSCSRGSMAHRLKQWSVNLALLMGSLLVAVLVVELASRVVLPVSAGAKRIGPDGKELRSWLTPGSQYRQVSSEYDAPTMITGRGHRVPEVEHNPDVIFLGDSFTFGWGLGDEETFAYIYCQSLQISCANLGNPGVGTVEEIAILKTHLERWRWHPREVKIFIFVMTASFSAGNDLADNFEFGRSREQGGVEEGASDSASRNPGSTSNVIGLLAEKVLGLRETVLRYSNLVRVAKFYWGPLLRSRLLPALDEARLNEALAITREALHELHAISKSRGFHYSVYLIHPVQDLMNGTHRRTALDLQEISPVRVASTAGLFTGHPERYYYPYDGHLNKYGSRQIAEYLIRTDSLFGPVR